MPKVQSWSREKSKILGHTALKFTFQGKNGNIVLFIHDVLITDFVQYALLVGRDFTDSQAKLMEKTRIFICLITQKALMIHKKFFRMRMLQTFP